MENFAAKQKYSLVQRPFFVNTNHYTTSEYTENESSDGVIGYHARLTRASRTYFSSHQNTKHEGLLLRRETRYPLRYTDSSSSDSLVVMTSALQTLCAIFVAKKGRSGW